MSVRRWSALFGNARGEEGGAGLYARGEHGRAGDRDLQCVNFSHLTRTGRGSERESALERRGSPSMCE